MNGIRVILSVIIKYKIKGKGYMYYIEDTRFGRFNFSDCEINQYKTVLIFYDIDRM